MSRRYLAMLALLAALVTGAVLVLLPTPVNQSSAPAGKLLFPGLEQNVNAAVELELRGAGDATLVTLRKRDTGWQVVQLNGYPADWNVLRPALAGLARARVLELKTANPAYYPRLGVEDISTIDARGLELRLEAGEQHYSVIVGAPAESRTGRYVRLVDGTQSLLVDFSHELPREASGWVDRAIVDLPAALVAEVTVAHADGERLNVSKLSADDADYRLAELPAGREAASSWAVNALGGLFANLELTKVRPAADLDWSGAIQLEALAFSGLTLNAQLLLLDDNGWLQLEAGGEAAAEAAGEINQRVAGWAYAIPGYQAEAMNKRMSDLLKPIAEGE